MRLVSFLVLILLLPYSAIAQEEELEQPNYRITVTADRLEEPESQKTDSVTVVTREEIEIHQWNLVVDVLRQVPGLALVQSGSPGKLTSVFLRGAGASQVLVMLDGIPINNPYFGGVNFEDLTTDNIERIEVLRGPQSPLYGSDSIGGVIHLISRDGSTGNRIQASFEGGSFETFRERISASGSQDSVNYAVSFLRQDTAGQTDNDEFRENVFQANAGIRVSDTTRLTFLSQVYDSQVGIPFHFLFDPADFSTYIAPSPDQNQEGATALFGAGIQHNAGAFLNLNAKLSYVDRSLLNEDPGTFAPLLQSDSGVWRISFQNDMTLNEQNTLTAGYEFENEAILAEDHNGSFLDETIRNHSVFVQEKLESGPWILTAGVRWDHYNTFGDTVNPRVSVAYRLNDAWKLRGSVGTGFRAPSAGDLAYPFYGNPDLQPEKSISWEIGTEKFLGNGLAVTVSYFDNRFDDLITFDPVTFIAGNVAEATSRGVELGGSWRQGEWEISGNYTYLYTRDEVTGERLFRRPEHFGNIRIGYFTEKWGAAFSMIGVGDRLESDFIQLTNVLNPGYAKFDIAGHYQITDLLRLKLRVENIFDQQYEEVLYYPAPGIGVFGGVELGF